VTSSKQWFESWFDSPYYHILYEDRDKREAQLFLDNLLHLLLPASHSKMLDVACGRGRHAIYLNSKGYDVAAYDLSASNIEFDRRFENETLHFFIHDMRDVFETGTFDFVFNLFSSFGYFEGEVENQKVIASHAQALKTGGLLILDYMNTQYMTSCIREKEHKHVEGITFHISKKIERGTVNKTICFKEGGREHEYHEKLRLFTLPDFERMFSQNQLRLKRVFGNYSLQPFDEEKSERLILVAEKIPG
jgi:SAM-dependent methyltransferase